MQGSLDFWSCVHVCGAEAVDRVNSWRENAQKQVSSNDQSIGTLKATTRLLPGGKERYIVRVYNPTTSQAEVFVAVRLECHFYEYVLKLPGNAQERFCKKIQFAAQVADGNMGDSFYRAIIELHQDDVLSPIKVITTFTKEALFPKYY